MIEIIYDSEGRGGLRPAIICDTCGAEVSEKKNGKVTFKLKDGGRVSFHCNECEPDTALWYESEIQTKHIDEFLLMVAINAGCMPIFGAYISGNDAVSRKCKKCGDEYFDQHESHLCYVCRAEERDVE